MGKRSLGKPTSRRRPVKKHVVCLESLWDGDLEQRLSVEPLLRLSSQVNRVPFVHLTCNTSGELQYNIALLRRKRGLGILYLAFHGWPGHLELDGAVVTLEELAGWMGQSYRGWIVHFASCGTINTAPDRMRRFLDDTGLAMAVGYSKSVDWTSGAAMDLLLLHSMQRYSRYKMMWKRIQSHYSDLVASTGLMAMASA